LESSNSEEADSQEGNFMLEKQEFGMNDIIE